MRHSIWASDLVCEPESAHKCSFIFYDFNLPLWVRPWHACGGVFFAYRWVVPFFIYLVIYIYCGHFILGFDASSIYKWSLSDKVAWRLSFYLCGHNLVGGHSWHIDEVKASTLKVTCTTFYEECSALLNLSCTYIRDLWLNVHLVEPYKWP